MSPLFTTVTLAVSCITPSKDNVTFPLRCEIERGRVGIVGLGRIVLVVVEVDARAADQGRESRAAA